MGPTVDGQLTFDAAASAAARDRSIHQVDAAAEPDWKDAAFTAVTVMAEWFPNGFTSDDVWRWLKANVPEDVVLPHEPRAMGPVMQRAQRAGLIQPTAEFRASERVAAHCNPKRVWVRV